MISQVLAFEVEISKLTANLKAEQSIPKHFYYYLQLLTFTMHNANTVYRMVKLGWINLKCLQLEITDGWEKNHLLLCLMGFLLHRQYWLRWFSHSFQCVQQHKTLEESAKNKLKPYQSRRVRYFPWPSCSQDPTVSQTALLSKQVPPPCCLTLWVLRKGVR